MDAVESISQLLSLLTLVGGGIVVLQVVLIAAWLLSNTNKAVTQLVSILSKYALECSFIIATIATLGSLFYSEIAGYTPCKLCWFQRIFMYPQMLLLGIATWKNDRAIANYILPLTTIGGVISAYHYYMQVNPNAVGPCSTIGFSASCSQQFVLDYGYITIPMMALTAFAMIALTMLTTKLASQKKA